jgi:predicted AlkP superfamily phosphohydrolase/phosphomutase
VALVPAALSGCGAEVARVEGFPPERDPSEFPGITYPAAQGSIPRPGSLHGPVWLVGLDGATWDLIRPMAERGELPNFRELMTEGCFATLQSESPTISPALWATIATGVPRFHHGITNFRVKVPGSYRLVQAGPPDRRAPALWELVGAAGGSSAVISWFGSYPAEKIRGFYISKGFDPESPGLGQVRPESLAAILEKDSSVRMRRRDLEEIGWSEDYRRALVEDARTFAALKVTLSQGSPEFVAVYFSGIDVVQHISWRHMEPESQAFPEDGEPDPDLAGIIPAYYRYMDHTLGRMRELAGDDATFVVVSDHGGGPMGREEAFVPTLPGLLSGMGLLRGEDGPVFTMSQPYRHEKPIWLNIEGVEPSGVIPGSEAGEKARSIAARLTALRTGRGEPVFASVRDLSAGPGWKPGTPAISVRFSYAVRSAETILDGENEINARLVVSRLPDASGSHRPDGIFLLHGPGIRSGWLRSPASIYQIAPTILYLLGLPQDGRMIRWAPAEGGVLTAALEPDLLRRNPVRMIPEYPGTDRAPLLRAGAGQPADPAQETEMEKLRTLGYIR